MTKAMREEFLKRFAYFSGEPRLITPHTSAEVVIKWTDRYFLAKEEILKAIPREIEVDMVMGDEHREYDEGYENGFNKCIEEMKKTLGLEKV